MKSLFTILSLASALALISCGPTPEEAVTGETDNQTVVETAANPAIETDTADENLVLETEKQKLSYAIGLQIGMQMQELAQQDQIEPSIITVAIDDMLSGREARMTPQEAMQVQQQFFMRMQEEQQAMMAKQGEEQLSAGKEFLAQNSQREEVKVTESGLQYEVLRKGEGESPSLDNAVQVHYEGRLLDGTVFDSSYERGEPVTFPVNGVIKGWSEGVQLMNEGAKYKFYIPSELAYGPQGAGQGQIPPHATLVFTVELLDVMDAPPAARPGGGQDEQIRQALEQAIRQAQEKAQGGAQEAGEATNDALEDAQPEAGEATQDAAE